MSLDLFFNDTATTEIYTLSLHDALPISLRQSDRAGHHVYFSIPRLSQRNTHGQVQHSRRRRRDSESRVSRADPQVGRRDRKSTRLNSSHANISYAVFCLKKNIDLKNSMK